MEPLGGDIFAARAVLNNTYEILRVLGHNSTGDVYLARNQVSDRQVVIRVLRPASSCYAGDQALVKHATTLQDITHDAVLRYFDSGKTENGDPFLVMDYIDGPSLQNTMQAGRMDARDLLVIGQRLASGLAATHEKQVLHADLSPKNIILRGDRPDAAVMIGFGIAPNAAVSDAQVGCDPFAGTLEYAAPEQIRGEAAPQSDLYALGATLLAAWQGATPYREMSTDQMTSAKNEPLDTAGVPEPLAGVIAWLTAPELNDRPADAKEVAARIGDLLQQTAPPQAETGSFLARRWPLALGVVGLASLGIYLSGVLDPLFQDPLPHQSPYTFSAARGPDGVTSFSGYAPDAASATLLRTMLPDGAGLITLADGAPREDWAEVIAELVAGLSLEEWSVEIIDERATLEAMAPDTETRDRALNSVKALAMKTGFDMSVDITAGPRDLPRDVITKALQPLATCGQLTLRESDTHFGLGSTVTVAGQIAQADDTQRIHKALQSIAGDREVRVDTRLLNADICAVRAALPDIDEKGMTIWLGDGGTGEANTDGLYQLGDYPVAEVRLPAKLNGFLWVGLIEASGKVHTILPNRSRPEDDLEVLGAVEAGIRSVPVLHPDTALTKDPTLFATRVDAGFGKTEIVAIISDEPLLPENGFQASSSASLLKDLEPRIAGGTIEVRAIASRIFDTRN